MAEIEEPLLNTGLRPVASSVHLPDLPAGATFSQTVFNVINIFVGIGLLSLPYAFKAGGYLSGVALLVVAVLFCLAGHLIVKAFEYLPLGVARSYPELGKAALGKQGKKYVVVAAFIELFGGACMALLVTWQQLFVLLGNHGLLSLTRSHSAVAASVVVLVPLLWSSGGFRHTAALARLGLLSVGAVACVVVGTLALDPGREELPQPPPGREWASRTLPQAVGILAVSLSGHSSLPALRAGMARPSRFPALFTACFGAMAGLYCVVGAAGYWYYGSATLPVITGNLARAGPWVKYRVDTLVAALLFMSCLAKYPAIILVLQDLLVGLGAGATPPAARVAPRASALRALRLALLAATMGVSYAMRHSIAEVMSLVGGVASLSCSLLMPVLFYLVLAWAELGRSTRGALAALLVGGVGLMAFITTQNVLQLLAAFKQ